MSRVFTATALIVALACGSALSVVAQQPNQTDQRSPRDRSATVNAPNQQNRDANQADRPFDTLLASNVALMNQGEIAAAQIAMQNAKSEQVKQFAQTMMEDHRQMLQQLAQFTPIAQQAADDTRGENGTNQGDRPRDQNRQQDNNRNQDRNQDPSQTDNNQQGNNQEPNRTAQQTDNSNNSNNSQDSNNTTRSRNSQDQSTQQQGNNQQEPGLMNVIGLNQEVAQRCQNSLRQELERHQGQEFDMAYIGQQMVAHMHALDTLTVYEKYASEELRTAFAQAREKVQQHMQHAREIAEKLKSETPRVSVNP